MTKKNERAATDYQLKARLISALGRKPASADSMKHSQYEAALVYALARRHIGIEESDYGH